MTGRHWGESDLFLLKSLWESGLCLSDVAPYFPGRTLDAIHIKVKRMKFRHTTAQTAAIMSRKTSGENNGMWGRVSPRRGVVLSHAERAKLSQIVTLQFQNGRKRLFGSDNPAFGKPGYFRCKKFSITHRLNLSVSRKAYWASLTQDARNDRGMLMRQSLSKLKTTSIERIVGSWLQDWGVVNEPQSPIMFYTVDFLVGNKVIECHGDYWHGNPKFYSPGQYNKTQRANFHRDKRKSSFLKNHGYELLVLWEHDLHKNPDTCKLVLQEFLGIATT